MPTVTRPLLALGAGLLASAAAACGTDEPVELVYRLGGPPGASYVTTLTQDIIFDMGDHGGEGTREIRARYTIRAGDAPTDVTQQIGSVHVDSLRASMVWGQAQQRIDTRHLVGREFPMTVATTGGAPVYDSDSMPSIDMGDRGGGTVPMSLLVDYGFPAFPDRAVAAGSTWTETRIGRRLEGTLWTSADIVTTYRVAGMNTVGGVRCLDIESTSAGTLSDASGHGMELEYDGRLQGTARWCFDPASGELLEMTGEETTTGRAPWPNGATATIDQTTKVEIRNVRGDA